MALFKKFILLPPLRSPESFYATYRGPWPFVKKWPLVYLQTTKKAPKSISVARTDGRTDGRTDAHTHGQRGNSIPTTNKVCGGYNLIWNTLDSEDVVYLFSILIISYINENCWITGYTNQTPSKHFGQKKCLNSTPPKMRKYA